MDLYLTMLKELPVELQEVVWKTYHSTYVLPDLMKEVEDKLNIIEYNIVLKKCSALVQEIVDKLVAIYTQAQMGFEVCVDVAFDRLLEGNQSNYDKIALLHIIKDNINNPYLMRIMIENTEMVEAYGCSKCTQLHVLMETLQDVCDLVTPFQGYFQNMELANDLLFEE